MHRLSVKKSSGWTQINDLVHAEKAALTTKLREKMLIKLLHIVILFTLGG
jgi:hypothetical protein